MAKEFNNDEVMDGVYIISIGWSLSLYHLIQLIFLLQTPSLPLAVLPLDSLDKTKSANAAWLFI